jgi:hypothetical protein
MIWNYYQMSAEKTIKGLRARPKFSLHVKHLKFVFDFHGINHVSIMEQSLGDILALRNLRTLEFCCLENMCHVSWAHVQLPPLESFIIRHSCCDGLAWILDIIHNTRGTLKCIKLIDITIDERDERPKLQWNHLLEATKILHTAATIEISRPRVRVSATIVNHNGYMVEVFPEVHAVSFTPSPDTDTEPDTTASTDSTLVSVCIGVEAGTRGLHYFTKAGNLQESLSCMINSYKELITEEEIWTSGALGYVLGFANSSDEEESDNEGLSNVEAELYDLYDEEYDEVGGYLEGYDHFLLK